jgi:hypothetical protein
MLQMMIIYNIVVQPDDDSATSDGQVMAGASKKQWDMGLDVVRYLKGAKDLELTYRRLDGCNGLAVVAYADSDFVEMQDAQGYVASVEMQDAQGYVARCTTLRTSSFCLVVWSARRYQHYSLGGHGFKPCS